MKRITLTNKRGMAVDILSLGARVASIRFPVAGKPMEMTLGYQDDSQYADDSFYLGATCGRVCNRISNAQFSLDGRAYQLVKNDNDNCLHGGVNNFSHRTWQVEEASLTQQNVRLTLCSADGDQGFPGDVKVSVNYRLTEDNQLRIEFFANTNAATPVNLTNHTYFNLGEPDARALKLQINANNYLELDDANVPTGKILSVADTDFDLNHQAPVGRREKVSEDSSITSRLGFDHCFVLNNNDMTQPNAVLTSLKNKLKMTLFTDQKAIQLYTGAYLSKPFLPYQGLCLEAQNFTNAINIGHFPSCVLRENQQYRQRITLAFART